MRKVICTILIIILLSYSMCIYAEDLQITNNQIEEEPKQNTEEELKQIEDLQNKSDEINNQIKENLQKLEIVEEELTKNLMQLQEIDSKIQVSEEEFAKLSNEVEELNASINKSEDDLKKREEKYTKVKRQADEALIAMYEAGDVQYLDVLLGSKSIFGFISNYQLITELFEYNISLVEEAEKEKNEIEQIVKQLQSQKEKLTEKKKTAQKTNQVLQNTKTARQYYMSKLSEEEQQIQTEIDDYKLQMAEIETEIRNLAVLKTFGENYNGETMIWPIPGYTRITSQYGMRTHPITGLYSLHTGTDVSAPIGADFVAAASGVVTKAGFNKYYGNMVIIDHGGGIQTLYAHGSEIVVKLGDTVSQGQTILKVGSTGYSTGPHAHFEIRVNGSTVNPLEYIKPE